MYPCKKEGTETRIRQACDRLYFQDKWLISNKTHGRTIAAGIANYLAPLFDGWDVDSDYNREGIEGQPKRRAEERSGVRGKLLIPDIIIHKRGPDGPDLVAIQVKGFGTQKIVKRTRKTSKTFGQDSNTPTYTDWSCAPIVMSLLPWAQTRPQPEGHHFWVSHSPRQLRYSHETDSIY